MERFKHPRVTLKSNGQTGGFLRFISMVKNTMGEILEQNLENHFLKLKLNHRVFEVKRKYALLDLISQLGLDKQKVKRLKELTSPMPGRVLKIMVKAGDQINIGDSLLSLRGHENGEHLKV